MVKNLQCLKTLQICYLRHAEHHAKNRTSLRGLDHDTLFLNDPLPTDELRGEMRHVVLDPELAIHSWRRRWKTVSIILRNSICGQPVLCWDDTSGIDMQKLNDFIISRLFMVHQQNYSVTYPFFSDSLLSSC